MKAILIAMAGLILASAALASDDVCEEQINEFVASRLHTTVTSYGYLGEDARYAKAWVSVANCKGSYVFTLRANDDECESAHYGHIPNYIDSVLAFGNCPQVSVW